MINLWRVFSDTTYVYNYKMTNIDYDVVFIISKLDATIDDSTVVESNHVYSMLSKIYGL